MNFSLQKYQKYQQELSQIYRIDSNKLHIFQTIPSTNPKAWELLNSGENPPFTVMALKQTVGRGQWGKTWISSEGGLYLSVMVEPNIPINDSFHLTMATAWGIAEILNNYGFPVFIKWSNDLILNERKLGGIKIETRSRKNIIQYAVIGVGINWINAVPELGINLESFCKEYNHINFSSVEHLAATIITGILSGYQQYFDSGANYILDKYQSLLNSLGKKVYLDNKTGMITGILATGQLQVKLKNSNQAQDTINLVPGQISIGYD
ncbi:MAG: biotin--[acetyl-CoA-carboxylase] ligase [Xenococcaceae cyanobacterium]